MKKIISIMLTATLMLPSAAAFAADGVRESTEGEKYVAQTAPNVDYNMNIDWKFTMPDYPEYTIESGTNAGKTTTYYPLQEAMPYVQDDNGHQFYETDYDDSAWETVSVPHTFNAHELFDGYPSGSGDAVTRGVAFYRKDLVLDTKHDGQKIILEFEGNRQSMYVWVNGEKAGTYSLGVDPFAFDITDFVHCDGTANTIAIAVDNSGGGNATAFQAETRPGSEWGTNDGFNWQWNSAGFNPVLGGLTRNVILHTKNSVYQTLPLYSNLKTKGAYIYGTDYDVAGKTVTINVESEVRNESESDADVTIDVDVVDEDGICQWSFSAAETANVPVASDKGSRFESLIPEDAYDWDDWNDGGQSGDEPTVAATDISTVETEIIKASMTVSDVRLWSPDDPYLYDVYITLKDGDGNVLDVTKTTTGFRKVEVKGGAENGGVYINNKYYYLKGYAQRASQEWASIGTSVDWLEDFDISLVRESNANHIRWMHIAAHPSSIRSCDKYGIVVTQPAGDGEGDQVGRMWDQRVEVMRDTIIYFRNSPSIVFWEAGNNSISADHMAEMTSLRKELDPNGGKVMGCRSLGHNSDSGTISDERKQAVENAEYVGTMLGRCIESDAGMRNYSDEIIDTKAVMETEYYREEAPRRVWDDYSAPWYGYQHNAVRKDADTWDLTSEDFVLGQVEAFNHYYSNRIASNSSRPTYSGAAMLCWTDSAQHGRNYATENARMSGRTDAVRIKKQSFYASQVMQSSKPAVYLLGHWNYSSNAEDYPEGTDPTAKTMYVIATGCKYVDLYVDGERVGRSVTAKNGFVYEFPNIDITKTGGYIEAIGYNTKGEELAKHRIETAGEAAQIKLTPVTGPDGLRADGSDLAYFDVEVVDSEGRVLPTDYSRIEFSITGDAELCGGYNSGSAPYNDLDQDYPNQSLNTMGNVLYSECGVNRMFIRAGRTAGNITVTATAPTLNLTACATVTSSAVDTENGLTEQMPQSEKPQIEPEPETEDPTTAAMIPVISSAKTIFGDGGNTYVVADNTDNRTYISLYINDEKTDLGAYLDSGTVFGDLAGFMDAIGGICEGIPEAGTDISGVEITMTWNETTVRIKDVDVLDETGEKQETLGQRPEWSGDGTKLYADLAKIASQLGVPYSWVYGSTECYFSTITQSENE